jgi:hypothetical protein
VRDEASGTKIRDAGESCGRGDAVWGKRHLQSLSVVTTSVAQNPTKLRC